VNTSHASNQESKTGETSMILGNAYIQSGPHASERGPLYIMVRPAGYSIAGSGFSRYYLTLESAQRAFARLESRGYSASVITHTNNPRGMGFAVLVSRYAR
jgi:hypothetical protein